MRRPSRREPVFVEDVSQDGRYIAITPGVRSELAIPLVHRDRLVGVLNIEGPDERAFHPQARTALQVLASHLALAIENASFHRETRRYAALLATLYDIGKETASILDLDQLLHRVADVVKRVIDYEMFGILLLDEERRELVLRKSVSYGIVQEKTRIALGEGLCGTAALTKQPILVADVRNGPALPRAHPGDALRARGSARHQGPRGGGVRPGVARSSTASTRSTCKVLTALAGQVAVAIENARLYDELVRREMRLHRELAIARDVQHGLFPEEDPSGQGLGVVGPLPARARAGRRPLRLLRHR